MLLKCLNGTVKCLLPAQCGSDFDDHHDATVLSEVSLLEGCSVLLNVSKVGVGEFAALTG